MTKQMVNISLGCGPEYSPVNFTYFIRIYTYLGYAHVVNSGWIPRVCSESKFYICEKDLDDTPTNGKHY